MNPYPAVWASRERFCGDFLISPPWKLLYIPVFKPWGPSSPGLPQASPSGGTGHMYGGSSRVTLSRQGLPVTFDPNLAATVRALPRLWARLAPWAHRLLPLPLQVSRPKLALENAPGPGGGRGHGSYRAGLCACVLGQLAAGSLNFNCRN